MQARTRSHTISNHIERKQQKEHKGRKERGHDQAQNKQTIYNLSFAVFIRSLNFAVFMNFAIKQQHTVFLLIFE